MEIWTVLFPILLTDIFNPVLFAFLVYAAGTDRPVVLSSSMLLGHTAAYLGAGFVLALFLEKITAYLASPGTVILLIEGGLGLLLIWLAISARQDTGRRPDEEQPKLTMAGAFGFGAMINFIGIPFAVPYFAAIDQILKAEFSTGQAMMALVGYNLAYALPFATVPLLSAAMGQDARPILARVNAFIDRVSSFLLPLLLGVLGLALLADAVKYFMTGAPLF